MKRILLILSALMLASLACNIGGMVQNTINEQANQLVDNVLGEGAGDVVGGLLGGGSEIGGAASLWADVPRMDDMQERQLELPLMARIAMQAMLGQMFSSAGGDAEMVTFSTTHSAADVHAFYAQAFQGSEWKTDEGQGCYSGAEAGIQDVGLFCLFMKEEFDTETALLIFANQEDPSLPTYLYFVRVDMPQATPTP